MKNHNTLIKLAFVAWAIGAVFSLAAIIGLVYVIVHFIAKFW